METGDVADVLHPADVTVTASVTLPKLPAVKVMVSVPRPPVIEPPPMVHA